MQSLLTIADFERLAKQKLVSPARDYYMSGADAMVTLNSTRQALDQIKLKRAAEVDPSMFQGTTTTILGTKVNSPIMIASTAFHRLAHPEGEVAMAKAAENCNQTALSLSNWATSTNEEVGQAAPSCLKFFQIYMSKSEAVNIDLWKRVKNAGFSALLLTTDTQLLGKREKDTRNGFELPPHLNLANLTKYESTGETNTLKAN